MAAAAPSRSRSYDSYNARRRLRRQAAIAVRSAERAKEAAAAAILQQRETRVVSIGTRRIPLGALAGTGTAHPFLPDGHAGTSCMACFGWSNDYRHWTAS